MSECGLNDEGGKVLAEGLFNNVKLQKLNISKNNFSDEVVGLLFRNFQPVLLELNISENKMECLGVQGFC